MALIHKKQKILREIIQQGGGHAARRTARQHRRVVFNALANSHFGQHLDVIVRSLLDALGFNELALGGKLLHLLVTLGDTVDIYLAYMSDLAIRVEFFGDEIDRITEFNPVTGTRQNVVKHVAIFPASHYIVSADKKAAAIEKIRAECDEQVKKFTADGKLIEAQRIPGRRLMTMLR